MGQVHLPIVSITLACMPQHGKSTRITTPTNTFLLGRTSFPHATYRRQICRFKVSPQRKTIGKFTTIGFRTIITISVRPKLGSSIVAPMQQLISFPDPKPLLFLASTTSLAKILATRRRVVRWVGGLQARRVRRRVPPPQRFLCCHSPRSLRLAMQEQHTQGAMWAQDRLAYGRMAQRFMAPEMVKGSLEFELEFTQVVQM